MLMTSPLSLCTGSVVDGLYFIQQGSIKLMSSTDPSVCVAEILPGQFYGDMEVLYDKPAAMTAVVASRYIILGVFLYPILLEFLKLMRNSFVAPLFFSCPPAACAPSCQVSTLTWKIGVLLWNTYQTIVIYSTIYGGKNSSLAHFLRYITFCWC